MSLGHREGLVRVARQFDALVVTDDVYDFLQWPSSAPISAPFPSQAYVPRVVDVDRWVAASTFIAAAVDTGARFLDGGPTDEFGNTVSNGSFSKIIGPGCRTGWAEGAEALAYGLSQT